MARDLAPKYKRSRREGVELSPDLDKAGSAKSPLTRRKYAPGVHGPKGGWGRMSNYGRQLREKQKAKRIYGILERQFRNYYNAAMRKTGDTGEVMLSLLERRLDNVVYRLGFAKTRRLARQMVTHGHVLVNGKKVNIPSFQVRVGEKITLKDKIASRLPEGKASSAVMGEPDLAEARLSVDMRPIIEFYSR